MGRVNQSLKGSIIDQPIVLASSNLLITLSAAKAEMPSRDFALVEQCVEIFCKDDSCCKTNNDEQQFCVLNCCLPSPHSVRLYC
ncbi:Volume-regulated anion channel subunit LRRC8D [Trichinella spiralis]|uniref:Volume-regulated anion channel subunit LRRC8D n=1 Tax=Trichinella spiralis TaxID=6334 RepID=A0ABR3KB04_TRISP